PLNILVDQPLNERVINEGKAKVICIDFNLNNKELDYEGVHIEDYDFSRLTKYLYRDHPSHRFRITPTDKICTLEKTSCRIVYWFRKFDKYLSNDFIKDFKNKLIKENEIKENIIEDVEEKFKSLDTDSKNNCLLTFTFNSDGKQKYLGDLEIFKTILKEEGVKEFWVPNIPLKQGRCCLCEEKKKISRPREPFSFYTVNPKGFAQDFEVEKSWKQLPICQDCIFALAAGRKFLDNYLSKWFYGYRFYVIPSFIFEGLKEQFMEEIIDLKEEKKYEFSLLSEEDNLSYYIKNHNDVVTLIYVFYDLKRGGKNFDILKVVEDVPPSWIKQIIDSFEDVISKTIFKETSLKKIFGGKWEGDLIYGAYNGKKQRYMTFGGMLRTFYPNSESTGNHDKEFLDITGNILSKQKFQENILIEAFMREIRNSHVKQNEWNERLLSLKSLYILNVIKKLNLLMGENDMNEENKSLEYEKETDRNKTESFFNEFSNTFDTNAKKVVFLEGVLTKLLLDIQYAKRNSTPFRSKLRGLRLDENKVKHLFPEITEKLRQYDKAYPWLEEMMSHYFIAADNEGWNIDKNEISYYFALGLNIGRIFKRKEEIGENNE
ncbi:MAG: TIGR02556 family CRISPR-associated protein, partial [Elusimicrobiota bacterium]